MSSLPPATHSFLAFVGREQTGQNGVFRLSCSMFCNCKQLTAEIVYSTAHACHKVLTRSRTVWGTYMRVPPKKAGALLLCHGYTHWVSHERRECSMNIALAAESARREYCYGCCPPRTEVVCSYAELCFCLLLELLCQPEGSQCVCSPYGSSPRFPAS